MHTVTRVQASGLSSNKPPPAINLTDGALKHLQKLKAERSGANGGRLLLRVGVKTGGCSGMSYELDFAEESSLAPTDSIFEYGDGSIAVCTDAKALLYVFGMELGWSDALIDGGFKFRNPNADKSCSCGKSFGVTNQPMPAKPQPCSSSSSG